MRRLSLFLVAFLAAPLAAQTSQNILWSNGSSPTGGGRNAFPWGSAGIRYQYVLDMGSTVTCLVQDIMVAGDSGAADLMIEHTDIEISMGHTAVTNATTSTAWDTNLPLANKTLVYRGPLTIFHQNGTWRGIGLPNPYRFIRRGTEANLCIEIITRAIQGRATPSNFYFPESASTSPGEIRAFRFDWVNNTTQPALTGSAASRIGILCNDGNFVVTGSGCSGVQMSGGSTTTPWPKLGQPFQIAISGARPASPAVLFLGLRHAPAIDLTALGAAGCTWYVNPVLTFGSAANGTGDATLALPMPAGLLGARAWFQWLNVNPSANTLGYTFSPMGTLILGS